MKVIFLDVDGVLNSCQYYKKRQDPGSNIDEARVLLLKGLVERTGAILVLSSSWRIDWESCQPCQDLSMGELTRLLKKHGMEIEGKTPELQPDACLKLLNSSGYPKEKLAHGELGTYAYDRVFEVGAWLAGQEQKVESFAILDDNDFNWKILGYQKYWVKTCWEREGLEPSHVEKAVKILNRRKFF